MPQRQRASTSRAPAPPARPTPIADESVIWYATRRRVAYQMTLSLSARHWFTGPKVQGTPEELEAAERALQALG